MTVCQWSEEELAAWGLRRLLRPRDSTEAIYIHRQRRWAREAGMTVPARSDVYAVDTRQVKTLLAQEVD